MSTTTVERDRTTIAVVGAGAAGTLVATHLARTAARRGTPVDVVLVDPAERWGRGTAFGTLDDGHLLNVPAVGMSALPEDPTHFLSWCLRQEDWSHVQPGTFAPRRLYGRYLDDTMTAAFAASLDLARPRHLRTRAVGVRCRDREAVVTTCDGRRVTADAVVLATGLPEASTAWAPAGLATSAFFVPNPWAPGALDVVRRDHAGPADVLLVGTGLTMVDVALSLSGPSDRSDRVLHAVSRHGRLPEVHAAELQLAATPDVADWGATLDDIRTHATRHLEDVARTAGDWRPAADGLRFQVAALWQRLGEEDRLRFLGTDAWRWNTLRHRMPPSSALTLGELRAGDRLMLGAAEVLEAEPLTRGGLAVRLSDGTRREVGWVVNCAGPQTDVRHLCDPLVDDLLQPRAGVAAAIVATAGMGFRTRDGRLVDSAGSADAPLWTLGALRRGELWESTAVPEIRSQARAVATAVLDQVAPLPRRLADGRLVSGHHPVARPRDPLGLPISTTTEAAAAYNAGLERVMRLQEGAEALLRRAADLDPAFALAHAALAMLGHEAGADADVRACLDRARNAVRVKGDDRERSWVDVVGRRIEDVRGAGSTALTNHIATHPRDALAVSAAVPTIAFSGVIDVRQEAWELVEGLAPAYGDHWWYISLLAFVRQDQERFEEAGMLAESALSCEPSSGHAVHAATHVMYETGQHDGGRVWLDHWVAQSGRSASHRAHFAWHAALHELALGDIEAVRRRYYTQLAPPTVTGVRSLIDSASLLWRWRVTVADWDTGIAAGLPGSQGGAFPDTGAPPPVDDVLEAAGADLLERPQTPFVALHAALALAAGGRDAQLAALHRHCLGARDAVLRTVVATVCEGLAAALAERWSEAVARLVETLPVLVRVGGSAAQREVIEETLLFCQVRAGDTVAASALIESRINRRPSVLDRRRLQSLRLAESTPVA